MTTLGRPLPRGLGNPRDDRGRQLSENLTTPAGAGITAAVGGHYSQSVSRVGGQITTQIIIDLTGLRSSAAGDIIGVQGSTNPAHIGRINIGDSGTIVGGLVTCIETPATGEPDISVFAAVEGTGIADQAVSALTETALLAPGDDWDNGVQLGLTAVPTDGAYLYLVSAAADVGVYTGGKLLITLYGI